MFNQNDELDSPKSEKRRPRTRVREVDFMRVEDTLNNQPLALFELEVKKGIAIAKSPLEELEWRERQSRDHQLRRISKYKLSCLVRKAKLTPRQQQVYQLIWIKGFPIKRTAEILGICRPRVAILKGRILKFLFAVLEEEKNRKHLAAKARLACKTKKQCAIWELYFKKGKTISEIARVLNLSRQAVQQLMKRILPRR